MCLIVPMYNGSRGDSTDVISEATSEQSDIDGQLCNSQDNDACNIGFVKGSGLVLAIGIGVGVEDGNDHRYREGVLPPLGAKHRFEGSCDS